MTRIFIVDDHVVLRNGLSALLMADTELQVVGEASHGQELLDQLATTPADLVMLDINMPVLDGIATAHRLQAEYPQVHVLMLSMIDQPVRIKQALDAGALGYILKSADHAEMLAAIRAVAAGKRFLSTELGLLLLDMVLSGEEPPPAPAAAGGAARLTRREREVLQLVADGLTTQQIANQLFTSKRTIETHRQNILDKIGAKNTASLIRHAMALGYLLPKGQSASAG